jgi:hypothetical protein
MLKQVPVDDADIPGGSDYHPSPSVDVVLQGAAAKSEKQVSVGRVKTVASPPP